MEKKTDTSAGLWLSTQSRIILYQLANQSTNAKWRFHQVIHYYWYFLTQSIQSTKQQNKMVSDMSYTTVSNVIDTWEQIRRIKDFEAVVGTKLFQKYGLSSFNDSLVITIATF
jgi:hypothetical protein